MSIAGTCFAIGGTGPKWVRRYLLPVLLGFIALISGVLWWKCLGMSLCLIGALSMGYGERTPYWMKFLVFCSYFASTAWLGFTPWQIMGPFLIFGLFFFSNLKNTAYVFFWKACEFIMGSLIGITVAALIAKPH
jgi:hypothetical protein